MSTGQGRGYTFTPGLIEGLLQRKVVRTSPNDELIDWVNEAQILICCDTQGGTENRGGRFQVHEMDKIKLT